MVLKLKPTRGMQAVTIIILTFSFFLTWTITGAQKSDNADNNNYYYIIILLLYCYIGNTNDILKYILNSSVKEVECDRFIIHVLISDEKSMRIIIVFKLKIFKIF